MGPGKPEEGVTQAQGVKDRRETGFLAPQHHSTTWKGHFLWGVSSSLASRATLPLSPMRTREVSGYKLVTLTSCCLPDH